MATIKSYTDLSQSKTLSKILPLESADNVIVSFGSSIGTKTVVMSFETLNIIRTPFSDVRQVVPCWSLSALLKILNFPSLTQNKEDEWEVCILDHKNDDYIEKTASNPVDACYEIMLKLKERNLL